MLKVVTIIVYAVTYCIMADGRHLTLLVSKLEYSGK